MADEPTLQRDDSGDWVKYLRDLLVHVTDNRSLEDADELDVFDSGLASALRRFQEEAGLDPTGVCDDETWEALRSETPRGGDEEDARVDPEGGSGAGGAEGSGEGDLLAQLGLTLIDLDFAGEPSVNRATLEWNIENKGNTVANSYNIKYKVTRDGDTLFPWYADTRTPQGGVAAGGLAPDALTVEDFNWHLENEMATVDEFDVLTLHIKLEPDEEWEKEAELEFRVNVADAAPKEPSGDEDEDDEWGDQQDLKKVESFKTA